MAGSGDVSFWQAARYVAELRKKSRLGHSFSLAPCWIVCLVFSESTFTSINAISVYESVLQIGY